MSSKDLRSRGWLLTIFEQPEGVEAPRSEDDIARMLDPLPWMGQLEAGHETHHRHYQVYVEARNALRFSTIKKMVPDAHIEPRKGSKKEAFDYCSKSDTRIAGPYYHGIDEPGADEPGARMDLSEISDALHHGGTVDEMLLDPAMAPRLAHCMTWARGVEASVAAERLRVYRTEDRHVEVHYIWGASRLGKTYAVLHTPDPAAPGDDLLGIPPRYLPVYEPEVVGDALRWDGYAGEDIVLLDEWDGSVRLGLLNRLLEGYHDTHLACRYHDTIAAYHTVYIVSNSAPEDFYHATSSWMNRLTDINHVDFYAINRLGFAEGECEADWAAMLDPAAPGSAADESLWEAA